MKGRKAGWVWKWPPDGFCLHWTGLMAQECGMGVRYRMVGDRGPDGTGLPMLPCSPYERAQARWDCPLRLMAGE